MNCFQCEIYSLGSLNLEHYFWILLSKLFDIEKNSKFFKCDEVKKPIKHRYKYFIAKLLYVHFYNACRIHINYNKVLRL